MVKTRRQDDNGDDECPGEWDEAKNGVLTLTMLTVKNGIPMLNDDNFEKDKDDAEFNQDNAEAGDDVNEVDDEDTDDNR